MNNQITFSLTFMISFALLGLITSCATKNEKESSEAVPSIPSEPVMIENDSLEYLTTMPNGRVFNMRMYADRPREMELERPPQPLYMSHSDDNGLTWSKSTVAFSYAAGKGVVYGGFNLADSKSNLHCFGLRYFKLSDKDQPGHAILLHNKSMDEGKTWTTPKEVDFGHPYTGSFNTVTELKNGRIILALSYSTEYLADRGERDFSIVTVHSDDGGDTWHIGTDNINVPKGDFIGHPGALEPVMIQLNDGRVWMIIRTQLGRFFQCFSTDNGSTWGETTPTDFLAPNAPGGIIRLDDGRLVFCWNDLSRFSELIGNQRQYLHVAISSDDGKTWSDSKQIAQRREGEKEDTNVAYPYMTPTRDGKVLVSYHRVGNRDGVTWWHPILEVVKIDPDWIAQK